MYKNVIKEVSIKEAEYYDPILKKYQGNPLIEAIRPPYSNKRDIRESFSVGLPDYFRMDLSSYSRFVRRLQIMELNDLRIPLAKQHEVEMEFYRGLCSSYGMRELRRSSLYSDDNPVRLIGDPKKPTMEGFTVLGYSGTGKSSTIDLILNKYDQVLKHTFEDGTEIIQIVYIVVNCKANSNFSSMFIEIGNQVDIALGTGSFYKNKIERAGNLGLKLSKVEEIIEQFSIGMIIFDEIELISFDSTKENSFQTLLTLANETKVAMSFIGTEDVCEDIFKALRNVRRSGKNIDFNEYIRDYNMFTNIMKTIFEYQWFDRKQELTKDIVDVFYEETHGIICLAILLYKYVTDNYLMAKKHFDITADFVKDTADEYFTNIRAALKKIDAIEKTEFNIKMKKAIKSDEDSFTKRINEDSKENEIKRIVDITSSTNENILIDSATALIKQLHDEYNNEKIKKVCKTIIKSNPSIDSKSLAKEALRRLTNKDKTKKPTKEELQISLNLQ